MERTVGRTHVWRSLGTANKAEAIRQARIVAYDLEVALRGEREPRADRPQIAAEATQNADATVEPPYPPKPPEKTLRTLLPIFLNDATKLRGDKVRMIYDNAIPIVGEVLGMDTPLRSIDREACRRLMDMLRWLPTNSKKRFPKMTAVEASEMAKAKKLTSTLGYAAINSYLKCLSALMNFAVNEGYIDRNPARGLRVVDPRHRRDRRLPFSNDQLRAIFHAPLYRGCVDDEHGYADIGPARPRRARFWVPLIALFSGMRMNEICQLDVADIQRVDEVDCFLVTSRSSGGGADKKVKTSTSERFVPIHPRLIEIGFLDFVDELRRSESAKLFPELPLSTTGYYSDPFSKWFRRFIHKAKATRPKTCFHSFRHCFRDALREARIDHDVALALGGWSSGSGTEGTLTAEAYGRGFRAKTLFEAMQRVDYPMLDLSHLMGISSPPTTATQALPS
ncbi:MAG: tyrosine-type recombinase/integrase [Phenylobacterium sp.]|nr:site-specific integrase [Phenylobacterium sp.]MDO8409054.1 tyrosine-type recombinase/integrase [Phenylobacterium sp.]